MAQRSAGAAHAVVGWVTFVLMLVSLYAIFLYAPLERVMREVQKIFYVHVGAAWNAFLAFAVVFVASVLYLTTQRAKWDVLAGASAEVGVLFTTLVLITGPIWGREAWGVWWTWEPRLTSTLVLWFIYVAYLLIRSGTAGDVRRSTLAAVFGIIGFVDVPIVYFSINLWGSHPKVLGPGGGGLDPRMLVALIITVFAFTGLYLYLLQKAMAVEEARRELDDLKDVLRKGDD